MKIIKWLIFNHYIAVGILKILLRLDNFLRSLINTFAICAEGGIHPKHRIMQYHKFFVDNISENDIVLDIGCGNGALTYDLAKKAKKVYAIDINKDNIAFAKKRYGSENIVYILGDATKHVFNERFDAIILSNILEHIENRIEFLKKIKPLANKFLIRVPMINRDWLVLYKKELGLSYMSDKSHYIEYTFAKLNDELEQAGLEIERYSIQFGEIWAIVR